MGGEVAPPFFSALDVARIPLSHPDAAPPLKEEG